MDRRNFVRGVGVLTVAGALAGCSQDNSGSGGNGETTTSGSDAEMVSAPSEVTNYLDGAKNFDGQMADMTGQDTVEVSVGAGDAGLAFGPAAVKVSTGTTVRWVWTGNGGSHNVVAESGGDFESDLSSSGGTTYEQTFDSAGTITYYCRPHEVSGMKGAIVVE